MVKPITPQEVVKAKQEEMPDEVIETWNHLIARAWDGHKSTIKLKDAVHELCKLTDDDGGDVPHMWKDIEPIFRKAGWKVKYDGPAYCESYDAIYVFSKGK